jgi:hypothetical protein
MLIGAAGGLVGVALVKLNVMWCRMRNRRGSWLAHYPVGEAVVVALFTALVRNRPAPPPAFCRLLAGGAAERAKCRRLSGGV